MSAHSAPPLLGKVVVVTRPAEQAGELSDRLRILGAEPIVAPAIRIEAPVAGGPLDDRIREAAAGRFAWVVFTSVSGVDAWFARAGAVGTHDLRAGVAAVGDGTASALRERGREPELVPGVFTTGALGEAFPRGEGSVLLPRADVATAGLEETLEAKGWTPVRVEAYSVRPSDGLPEEARQALAGPVDAVTFTSPSTVGGFTRLAAVPEGAAVVCIGPVTADAARSAGLAVDGVADPHTIDGLVQALVRVLT